MTWLRSPAGDAREDLGVQIDEYGFAELGPPALEEDSFAALRFEAEQARADAWERPRHATVGQKVRRAALGSVARSLLASPELLSLLRELAGREMTPSWDASCFTYYDAPSDFLAPHMDRQGSCPFTVLVYLDVAGDGHGLALDVFARGDEKGDSVALRIPARPNQIVIGRGGEFLHGRSPLAEGARVVVLTACYSEAERVVVGADAEARPGSAAATEDAETWAGRGFTAWQRGDQVRAYESFVRALELDASCARAWSGHGFVCWSQGEFELARRAFSEAARLDPHQPAHWSNVGLCLRDLDQPERAIALFRVALLLDAEYAPALNEWGNTLQDQGHAAEAVPLYQRALALDPSRAVVHHNLGVAWTRLDQPQHAHDAFTDALERDPQYAHSLEEIGILYADNGQIGEALNAFDRSGTERGASLRAFFAPGGPPEAGVTQRQGDLGAS